MQRLFKFIGHVCIDQQSGAVDGGHQSSAAPVDTQRQQPGLSFGRRLARMIKVAQIATLPGPVDLPARTSCEPGTMSASAEVEEARVHCVIIPNADG